MTIKTKCFHITTVIVAVASSSWSMGLNPLHAVQTEAVMTEGMTIEATNSFGTIKIKAGKGRERTFFWEGKKETVRLWKRPSRWFGSLGLYHPGGGRRVHLVAEEGQQHFCSVQEATEWLLLDHYRMNWVCTSDGFVVGWYKTEMPKKDYWAVIVEVWQIYVNGEKPDGLSFPFDHTLRVDGSPPQHTESKFIPSEPKEINSRLYSGWVLDVMLERKITTKDVEEILSKGRGEKLSNIPQRELWIYSEKINGRWISIVIDETGRVVEVV